MTSKRKVTKLRKMEVIKVIKKIKQYRLPFDYKYGGGYFVFSFNADEFNLHMTFRQLPMMKFGIWKTKSYGDKNWYFFAECFPYIDKFKPSRCEFGWDSLESMMEWISKCLKEPKFYISELESRYCEESEYFPHNFQDILKDYADDKYEDSHNGFSPEEYEVLGADRRELIKEIQMRVLEIKQLVREMTEARHVANRKTSQVEKAYCYEETVCPYMEKIREHIDILELEIDDEIWPLPKYRELLFTK